MSGGGDGQDHGEGLVRPFLVCKFHDDDTSDERASSDSEDERVRCGSTQTSVEGILHEVNKGYLLKREEVTQDSY